MQINPNSMSVQDVQALIDFQCERCKQGAWDVANECATCCLSIFGQYLFPIIQIYNSNTKEKEE